MLHYYFIGTNRLSYGSQENLFLVTSVCAISMIQGISAVQSVLCVAICNVILTECCLSVCGRVIQCRGLVSAFKVVKE